jgi:kynurenine formamidase
MKVIDLTHTIRESMPAYPGTEPPRFTSANTYEKDGFKETHLAMFSHTGTHMDAPAHLFADRTSLDQYDANQFIGKALVIECSELHEGDAITMQHLLPYGNKVNQADFLLFHTGWDRYWGSEAYFGDYPCVDFEVLDRIIQGGYKGIGFDVIGLDPIADLNLTRHKKLFSACDTVNIENLTNLAACGSGLFDFACLPLKFEDSDGAPIRAIAWNVEELKTQ